MASTHMKINRKVATAYLQSLRVLTTLSTKALWNVESKEATKNLEVNKIGLQNVHSTSRVTISW